MKRNPLPDIGDLIFVGLLVLILGLLPNYVFSDGSTGWHIVTGQYILEHAAVPRQDLISYTFADKSWVAYEWLYDALAAALVNVGGLNMLAAVTAGAIAFLFFLLYRD